LVGSRTSTTWRQGRALERSSQLQIYGAEFLNGTDRELLLAYHQVLVEV
jgi:hypothetical protein